MLSSARWLMLVTAATLALQSQGDGGIRLPDQPSQLENARERHSEAQGRGLLEWVGLGDDQDPYILKSTQACISGDLADCFKAQALRSFDDFFDKEIYSLTNNAKVIRVDSQARSLAREPLELSSQPRNEDSEWDSLTKYGLRKIEKFLRSTALELDIDDEVTSRGLLAPRFLDEISDELDIIEDKKAPPFRRNKLKKLFIPMLLILKIFKLKLLLFLPLILGLASFKKFLGFMALIIPGVIGYFKFCKPNLQAPFTGGNHYGGPQYSSAGVGLGPYREQPHFAAPQSYYQQGYGGGGGGVSFREHDNSAQDIAYQGWGDYRSKKTGDDIKAEV